MPCVCARARVCVCMCVCTRRRYQNGYSVAVGQSHVWLYTRVETMYWWALRTSDWHGEYVCVCVCVCVTVCVWTTSADGSLSEPAHVQAHVAHRIWGEFHTLCCCCVRALLTCVCVCAYACVYRYDLDLSDKPYKALRYHTHAVRGAAYHPTYPLFASCADDGTAQVFHGMVGENDICVSAPCLGTSSCERTTHVCVVLLAPGCV